MSGAQPGDETLLAFDFGARRTGVAIGNTLTGTARALAQICEPSNERRMERVAALIREWQPQRLVVGRPLHPDGARHESTARCERFARQLAGRFALPVELVDERYSTVAAAAQAAGRGPGATLDARAAAIILRQYLDERTSA
ncbi:MAG: Holliday junction resolvase RuvX [Burkholderiaceae bacterium]|nr:Holliday junction resolvase RuvX [Burkholderiaceae bacterium]